MSTDTTGAIDTHVDGTRVRVDLGVEDVGEEEGAGWVGGRPGGGTWITCAAID